MPSRLWRASGPGTALLAAAALVLVSPITALAQEKDTTRKVVAADNTKRNTDHKVTAQNQSGEKSDLVITKEVRRAIVKDTALSGYAHNVKIITVAGKVTLKGPVRSETEKAVIETMAKRIAGVTDVVNQLTIKLEKSGR